jgi:hypothetical protein
MNADDMLMNKRAREERLQIMLSAEELSAIDDFRFKFRLPSRASTIREILRRGLQALGHEAPDPHVRSTDYGVIGERRAGSKSRKARNTSNASD